MTKVGAEQNAFTNCARRSPRDSAMDGGSIPPISTNHCHNEEAPRSLSFIGIEGLLLFCEQRVFKGARPQFAHNVLTNYTGGGIAGSGSTLATYPANGLTVRRTVVPTVSNARIADLRTVHCRCPVAVASTTS